MSVSDPISDMLGRMRNAHLAKRDLVEMPHSRLLGEIARLLTREGFIADYAVEGGVKKTLRLFLKYQADGQPTIRGLRRMSKPGLRRYVTCEKIPRVLGGMGIAILSTSGGLVTGAEARRKKTGGELLCLVW